MKNTLSAKAVTKNLNLKYAVNQLNENVKNTRDRCQARETTRNQAASGLVLHLIGWVTDAIFFKTNHKSVLKTAIL